MDDLNLYAYGHDDPVDNVDPSGTACVTLLNSGSDYCRRALLYSEIDGVVRNKTRFFAAASATVQSLASMDIPVGGRFYTSPETRSLLSGLSKNLEHINLKVESDILRGVSVAGLGTLDSRIVHQEQSAVQSSLDQFAGSNPVAYGALVSEVNALLNPSSETSKALGSIYGSDRAYGAVLDSVRRSLGRDIDFTKQSDREKIGNAVIDKIRRDGGCDIAGIRLKSC